MLTAVIIDDEDEAVIGLSKLLSDFVSIPVKVAGTSNNLLDGVNIISSIKPDVVFLDIGLPDKNGMEIYNYFRKPDFKIIFVTAYNQYAIKALKQDALDYLLKPVDFIELREAVKKVQNALEVEKRLNDLEERASFINSPDFEGRSIIFEDNTGFILENTRNVEYCQAQKAYSAIYTNTGKMIIVSKTLKELQKQLPDNQFFRTHKSYLVNIYYIKKYFKAARSYVLLKSGKKIPVSARINPHIVKSIKKMLGS